MINQSIYYYIFLLCGWGMTLFVLFKCRYRQTKSDKELRDKIDELIGLNVCDICLVKTRKEER